MRKAAAWLTEDHRRGLTLATSTHRRILFACIAQADLLDVAVWSDSGGGWVLPTDRVADLGAALHWSDVIVRSRRVPAVADVAESSSIERAVE